MHSLIPKVVLSVPQQRCSPYASGRRALFVLCNIVAAPQRQPQLHLVVINKLNVEDFL